MAQSASAPHLWDPDYSGERKGFVYDNESLHDVLLDNMQSLSKDLELSDTFWKLLRQRSVVDKGVQRKIKKKRIKRAQAAALVHHVIEVEVYKFHGFVWALVNSNQSYLAEQLGFNPCDYLDMDVFMMSSSFRCPACQEFYTKAYILTGCGHYVCAPCVKGAQFLCKDNKKEDVTCPVPECSKVTEAFPSIEKIGLNEDKDYKDLGEAVVKRITEVKESKLQESGKKKIKETEMKAFQEEVGELQEKITSLQKHRDVLERHKAGVKEYIEEEVRKGQQALDEWATGNLAQYFDICRQVEEKLQKAHQWRKGASELSVLMRARPGFLEGCLKSLVKLPTEPITDAAGKLITKLDAGCPLSLLCSPSPYKPCISIPPAEAKFFTHWNLPQGHSCWKLAWLSDRLMVLTDKGVWSLDLNIDTAECKPTRIHQVSKAEDMSVASDGTWILSLRKAGIVEIHYPGLKEVKQWRPNGKKCPGRVFINNDYIFVDEDESQTVRSYSRELEYLDQFTLRTGDNCGNIYVTERGKLMKSSQNESRIYIMDLETKKVSSFGRKGEGDGELSYPWGVCTVNDDDYILVCDCHNDRVSVFTHDGQFIHNLHVEGGVHMPYRIAIVARQGKPTLMALCELIDGKCIVRVYHLE